MKRYVYRAMQPLLVFLAFGLCASMADARVKKTFRPYRADAFAHADMIFEATVEKVLRHRVMESFPAQHSLIFRVAKRDLRVLKGALPRNLVFEHYSAGGILRNRKYKGYVHFQPAIAKRYLFAADCVAYRRGKTVQRCSIIEFQQSSPALWNKWFTWHQTRVRTLGDLPAKVRFQVTHLNHGKFRLSLHNPLKKTIAISALRVIPGKPGAGKNRKRTILWKQALSVQQSSYYASSKANQLQSISKSTKTLIASEILKLTPNETISTVIDILGIPNLYMGCGGCHYRFRFHLGAQSRSAAFYYIHQSYHPIRQKLLKARTKAIAK